MLEGEISPDGFPKMNGIKVVRLAPNDAQDAPEYDAPPAGEQGVAIKAWPVPLASTPGIVGEMARLATEHSEADPVAIIYTSLVWGSAMFGRARFMNVGDSTHHPRLFAALVGASSRARKGTSTEPVRRFMTAAENHMDAAGTLPHGKRMQISPGPLSSGEGLVDAIRDKRDEDDDGGTEDKRFLCIEGELGAVLRAFQRQGNTLSTIVRTAWDGQNIAPLTKNNKVSATHPHICLIGHIVEQELEELLAASDVWNGFANRFLWLAVRRQKTVAFPRAMADDDVDSIGKELARIIAYNHAKDGHRITMSNAAMAFWADGYADLTVDHPGILGAVTSRAEAQALRLAMTLALFDGADRIELYHVQAAKALWQYAFDSASYIFGGVELDPTAQKILAALAAGPKTQTELWGCLGRHSTKDKMAGALKGLQERGRVTLDKQATAGRPSLTWRLMS